MRYERVRRRRSSGRFRECRVNSRVDFALSCARDEDPIRVSSAERRRRPRKGIRRRTANSTIIKFLVLRGGGGLGEATCIGGATSGSL
ncbi:hypothetical protein PUN28_009574 [Cardiocondyla obscurior]|uniref:Uncharacterized protein n=1 Tax=Cardiocondyla obscurior TaxID=286306 RepID=A0AAW2FYF1_9HYME